MYVCKHGAGSAKPVGNKKYTRRQTSQIKNT